MSGIDSLTNTALLKLLTANRQEELFKILLKRKTYWVVVRESEDYSGILSIFTSVKSAAIFCYKDILSKQQTCGLHREEIVSILMADRDFTSSYPLRDNRCDWRIYEFPTQIENELSELS